ncbi:MAG: hypothetical protein LBF62_13265 [Tannerellaceae bacterium]|jgi:hypothetical protein|nr:hypothetical protein [Tannerellaceae bacterium]
MEYIDKSEFKEEAEFIISSFDLFDSFKSDKNDKGEWSRTLLIQRLRQEQHNRCCYCMRNMENENEQKTLEHIIPKSITKKDDFNKYLNSETVLNSSNVCLTKEFIDKKEKKFPPFPHSVAYQNLTISCNGQVSKKYGLIGL